MSQFMVILNFTYPERQYADRPVYLDAKSWEEVPDALVRARLKHAPGWYLAGNQQFLVYEIAESRTIDLAKLAKKEQAKEAKEQKIREEERELKLFEKLEKKFGSRNKSTRGKNE